MSARDEGVIKFDCVWRPGAGPLPSEIALLDAWRRRCFDLGLVGATSDGIGYGNLSARIGSTRTFWVTGSGTGGVPKLGPAHYSRVIEAYPEHNRLVCEGPLKASSESMTHAVLYVALPDTQAVIHVHSASLWHSFSHRLPTTADDIPYGTPAMCRAVADLATSAKDGVIVMRGHEDGIIAFGSTADEAGNRILALLGNRRPTI